MKKLFALLLCLALVLSSVAFAGENVFETLEGMDWSFSSGVGGWSTDMRILANGYFTGEYHDSEMGEIGDGYPNGTVYFCAFEGQMSIDGQVDERTWKIRVISLTKTESKEYIDDGIRYVPSEPYGLAKGDEMILYAPGTPVSILSEEMQLWAHVFDQEAPPTELEDWFLMSESNDSGFVGYQAAGLANPWEDLTADALREASGLSFHVPEGAENVIYRYLPSESLAEMQFTLDSDEFCARIQPSSEPADISGMYFEWENEEAISINGCPGTISQAKADSEDWVELCRWYDAAQGLQYSLSVYTTELDGLDLTAVAERI